MAHQKPYAEICALPQIKYPIIQSSIGSSADPSLVIAVRGAGDLCTLGGCVYEPDTLDTAIKVIRKGMSKPFGMYHVLAEKRIQWK